MNKKIEPWRIVVAAIAIVYIIFMWVKKGIVSLDVTMSLPLILTNVAVTLVKVGAIALVVLLVKWLTNKIKK